MKRKNFIFFIMFIFVLVGVLLVSCGPKKKYVPVASVMRQRKLDVPFKKPSFGIVLRGFTDSEIFVDFPGALGTDLVNSDDDSPDAPDVPVDPDDVDPADETPEQRMQKGKEIEEIKGKIPIGLEEILRKHSLAGTDVSENVIIPEFDGHVVRKSTYYSVDSKEKRVVHLERNLGVLSTLFWNLYTYGGIVHLYLEGNDLEFQKEFYLALEYNYDLLKPFAYVYGKLSCDVAHKSFYNEQTKDKILKLKNNIVKRLRNYAKAYYIDVYQSLLAKKDKLNDKLSLKNVRILKSKLNEIELAKQELRTNVIQQFVDGVKKYEPYSLDSEYDIWPHLRDMFSGDFKSKCDAVISPAEKIKDILDNIQ
ncbi:Putative membrane spanning protein (plasmid) [Borrelia crocidurae DOU]|uniref:Putative membrane spanning protein n=1 Tax=Borrelia crocidurae DOU TaxID=1293575 RepID=W5SQW8_9SPIR|nr:virulence associated lipoprotein [Borrelia crocidurae]AHH07456.1 Putative membrane spanning protein [Borrelia crocidurae DOU]